MVRDWNSMLVFLAQRAPRDSINGGSSKLMRIVQERVTEAFGLEGACLITISAPRSLL